MKNLELRITFCLLPFTLCLFSGCQQPQQSKPGVSTVTLIEADKFPPHMVGVWRNDEHGWTFKFEPDGSILQLVHAIGRNSVIYGQTSVFPLHKGGFGQIEPGLWHVEYIGSTGEIAIEIQLDSFSYQILGSEIYGSSRDIFIGVLPEPGNTDWKLHWVSFQTFFTTTADKRYLDYELPRAEGEEDRGLIKFAKIQGPEKSSLKVF